MRRKADEREKKGSGKGEEGRRKGRRKADEKENKARRRGEEGKKKGRRKAGERQKKVKRRRIGIQVGRWGSLGAPLVSGRSQWGSDTVGSDKDWLWCHWCQDHLHMRQSDHAHTRTHTCADTKANPCAYTSTDPRPLPRRDAQEAELRAVQTWRRR